MAAQRTAEWLDSVEQGQTEYHLRQFSEPYQSTIAFERFLTQHDVIRQGLHIADICCGMGAPTAYIATRHPRANFDGIDINRHLITEGEIHTASIPNLRLITGDMFSLPACIPWKYDGIINIQSLSWLPEYQEPLNCFAKLSPEWMALSSLFYDGLVDCEIEVKDYSRPVHPLPYKKAFYNIYSIPMFQAFCDSLGYSEFVYERFEMDIDLPRPATSGMGTFTETLQCGTRIQFSGPLLMTWYFILIRKP